MSNSSSDELYLPSPIRGGGQSSYLNKDVRQPSALRPADRSSASASGPTTESSNVLPTSSSSSSDNGVFIKETNPPHPPHPPPPLATTQPPIKRDGTTSPKERPVLRLAMLSAQQRAEAHNNGEQYPATAPVRSQPLELPASGYFAPRGAIQRAQTSTTRQPTPAKPVQPPAPPNAGSRLKKSRFGRFPQVLRFSSRESVHIIEDNTSNSPMGVGGNPLYTPIGMPVPPTQSLGNAEPSITNSMSQDPPGLRRRLTKATTNSLAQLGRAFNPTSKSSPDSDSDSDYGAMSGPEDNMEKLLEKHSNNALRPPTDNIAANNADITNTPDFYPINPSTQNPGVIHVSMSGHHAAQNIVDSFLGTMGKSTHEHQKKTAQSKDAAGATGTDDATPADLEAGLGRPVPHTNQQLPGQYMMPPGLGPTPTSLRGVYANLTKLQGRMVEYQKKRDQRVHEAERREQKRQSEEEERKKRIDERRRRDCSPHNDDRLKRRALDKLAGIRNMAYSTQVRSRTVSPSPVSMSAIGSGSDHEGSGSEPPRNSFVLQSFRTMPRPESIRHMVDEIGDKHAHYAQYHHQYRPSTPGVATYTGNTTSAQSTASSPARSATQTPPRSATQSPLISPLNTPGWDEIIAAGGMLTDGSIGGQGALGGAGSRLSAFSSDNTMNSFESERQKILAQLADIFNRQNLLLLISRALMAFGAPLHRLESNLIATALHLDIQATFAVLPGIILISFGNGDTRTSETYIVRTSAGYDMHRLERTNRTIRRVLKGRISVGQGVKNIERILATPPIYPWWVMVMNYVLCSAAICPLFWNGSWRDASVAAMLGLIVSLLQLMTGRFSNYANLFEVSSAFIVSFIAALMQDYICFATVSFAGVALLLPGLAVTTSIIEMVSRNMITGTVRFVFAMARCFILGYGISVGSTLGTQVLGRSTTVNLLADQMSSSTGMGNCSSGLSKFWWFLLLPLLSISFTISISGHWRQWPSMMFAGCMAYTVSYFSGMSTALAPLAPAIAAFAMGLYANGMASFSNHRSAVEPILGGILLLVPGSLGLRTVLAFITSSGTNSGNFLYNMFATSLSIATGLFLSGMV
ncbi:pheromone-regulated protein prm10, partial [Kickxella alabastrina]